MPLYGNHREPGEQAAVYLSLSLSPKRKHGMNLADVFGS
jgi:hypothetical protein